MQMLLCAESADGRALPSILDKASRHASGDEVCTAGRTLSGGVSCLHRRNCHRLLCSMTPFLPQLRRSLGISSPTGVQYFGIAFHCTASQQWSCTACLHCGDMVHNVLAALDHAEDSVCAGDEIPAASALHHEPTAMQISSVYHQRVSWRTVTVHCLPVGSSHQLAQLPLLVLNI